MGFTLSSLFVYTNSDCGLQGKNAKKDFERAKNLGILEFSKQGFENLLNFSS
jgi:hypothetical protein